MRRRTFKCGKDAYAGGKDEELVELPEVRVDTEGNVIADDGRRGTVRLPDITVRPTYLDLTTYYPLRSDYITGHSALRGVKDTNGSMYIDHNGDYFYISRKPKHAGYNFVTNNCSDATREALEAATGNKINPYLFTTPGDVQDFFKEQYPDFKVITEGPKTILRAYVTPAEFDRAKAVSDSLNNADAEKYRQEALRVYREIGLKKPKFAPGKDKELPYPLRTSKDYDDSEAYQAGIVGDPRKFMPAKQEQIGADYWIQLANEPTWLDTFITTVNGGQLPEVIVKPTNDESWLFSLGKFAHNRRKPLADSYTRKVVANYLSRFDNENAKEYNARISRLADAIYDTNGVQFQKNNRKNKRAYYVPNTKTAKISNIDDVFSELAHPYQEWLGNNRMGDEFSENYDNDKDPRGGTRYAYPDTFEGETHGFFEPALKEWVETGSIGRSLPMLNEDLSNKKIVPKDRTEVTDSAASWNKQAIDRRVLANPQQLPLSKRIQYSIFDYPLLNKKKLFNPNDVVSGKTARTSQNYASGKDSGIHIKPENRGKFTRLKKRTGKSASWFKAHGTPAQKKMAVFALNSRKWSHKK